MQGSKKAAGFPEIVVETRAEWRAWLATHYGQKESVWLVYRKATRGGRLTIDEAVEEALCYGWIDSLPRKRDENYAMLLFSPRKPKSNWSAVNKRRAENAIAFGIMQPPGLEKIEQARRDGTWDALNGVDRLDIPDDLAAALQAMPPALTHFLAFPPSVRRAILEWILNARTAATRDKRVGETARLAKDNIRANQWKKS